MKIVQVKYRAGNLAIGKEGFETDRERAVLPTLIYAGMRSPADLITIFGLGWWKWGIRLIIHWRFKQ